MHSKNLARKPLSGDLWACFCMNVGDGGKVWGFVLSLGRDRGRVAPFMQGAQLTMPFGEFQYTIDDKGRVIIPPSFRDFVEDGAVVTRGMEGCLYLFPLTAWERIEAHLTTLPLTDGASRNFVRFFYSGAAKIKLDSAGRVSIPSPLRSFANLHDDEGGNNVVIAGAPNRLEIWQEAKWLASLATIQNEPPSPELLRELIG